MLSSRSLLVALFLGIGAVAGCATESGEGIDSADSELTQSGTVLGNIFPGESKAGNYSGAALAYTFSVTGNFNISADASIAGNDAQVFLTDSAFNVLSDGAGAHASVTTPAGTTKQYRIVFKGRNATPGSFNVSFNATPGSCTGSESWYDYRFTDCEGQHWTCPSGKPSFRNNCGCGCEL